MQGQAITFVQNMCTQIKLQMKIKPTPSYPAEKNNSPVHVRPQVKSFSTLNCRIY